MDGMNNNHKKTGIKIGAPNGTGVPTPNDLFAAAAHLFGATNPALRQPLPSGPMAPLASSPAMAPYQTNNSASFDFKQSKTDITSPKSNSAFPSLTSPSPTFEPKRPKSPFSPPQKSL